MVVAGDPQGVVLLSEPTASELESCSLLKLDNELSKEEFVSLLSRDLLALKLKTTHNATMCSSFRETPRSISSVEVP